MDLAGKVCLITGGTSGIGAATALALLAHKARVVVVSRGQSKLPDSLYAASEDDHADALHFVEADVADPAGCTAVVGQAVQHFGRLDVLVHSAGGAVPGSLQTLTEESWMRAFDVHVHAIFHLSRAAVPHIAAQGEGAIILLGSAAGMRGCLGALAYGVVKGALPQFARSLGRELADQGIRVNCVSPGVIRTPFQDFLTPEQTAHNIQNRIPLHREGTPQEVADLILTLIQNDFITGENFVIDGGMTMRIV